jgi:hypothetical protein
MLLNQLVEINEKGAVASSVNFSMMDDPEMNQNLCECFIFNYDPKKPELSSVGILDALRRSYHSRTEPNIHLMIQQYGKGKSHFAVAIANFFKKPFDSPEVQGILHQVEMATANKAKAIAEGLRLYKQNQRQRHLVICLSGDRGGDIRKHFLQALLKSLEEEGIQDSLAQHTCSEPLRYLENLNTEDRAKAEDYLESMGNPDGDLNRLIHLLRNNNPAVIPTVKNLARHIIGYTLDFSPNIDVEAILKDLLDNLCSGDNPRFQGILILFDELNYYLQSWAADQFGAGGTALQNITNICETYKGKIALLSFTQIHPSRAVGISATAKDSYLKISTRLAPKDSSYDEPASSLELVLDNLLIQKEDTPNWADFRSRWDNTLLSEARTAYEQRIKIYSQKGWSLDQFYRHLSKGCFPLHPLTAYLLCNLDFTQDRTAIQFIKGYVKDFIQTQPLEQAGQLNYIYPVALVDTFIENFSNYSVYTYYKKGLGLVAGSDDPDELTVLKALFLFYACGEKLTKSDREEHQEILTTLTGLPKSRIKAAIDKLEKTRDLIYYRPETKLYRFWEGITPTGIEEEIEDKIKDIPTSVNEIVVHCRSKSKVKDYLGDETITATQFAQDNKLVGADWRFEYKIYSIDGLLKALSSDLTLRDTKEKGILAYVLAETQEELQEFRRTVDKHLSSSPLKHQIAIAISSEETGDLSRVLLKIKTLENKQPSERRLLGTAYEQLHQRWEEQVDKQAERLLKSCTYHCIAVEKIPLAERLKPQRVISALLQDLYSFVPPVDGKEKMRSDHQTGAKIVRFVAQQLLAGSLTPQTLPPESYYRDVIDKIFVNQWGLLNRKYIAQKPTNEKIRAAWDLISQMTNLGGLAEKTVELQKIWKALSEPPYGYSDYTFTVLLAGWLADHRKEVSLWGAVSVSAKKGALVTSKSQSLKELANSDIFQKPSIFINDWIVKRKAKLIRRKKLEPPVLPPSPIDYNQAKQYLEAVVAFLDSSESDPVEVGEVTKTQERVFAGVEKIEAWFQPVEEAEALPNTVTLGVLLQLYPQLLQRPPAIDLTANAISVKPTQQQRDRQNLASQTIREQIEQRVIEQTERSESLPTEDACDAYQEEIGQLIHQLSQVSSLPPHLSEILRNSLQVADRTRAKIREQAQVGESMLKIQRLARDLDSDSTQQDYTSIRAEIEALQANISNGTQEAGQVQQILLDLDQRYRDLTQQIEMWEERFSGVTSPNQILELIKEIENQRRRFTEEASEQRIKTLQDQLGKELLRIQERDDAEKLVRAELSNAQQKLQRIRDLPGSKLPEAFLVYQELVTSSLPSLNLTVSLEEYQEKLEGFKAQGRTVISEKFAQVYNRKLNRLEDYESLKDSLQKSINIIATVDEFAEVRANIEQAIQHLEDQREELQQQLQEKQRQTQDKQTMQAIRQFKPAQINTIQLCEEGIKHVKNLQSQLNDAERFTTEINQIVQALTEKIASYQRSLADLGTRLATVNNLKDLDRIRTESAQLDFAFKDSAEYPAYQQLQERIELLKDDLDRVQSLETRDWQSDSILRCYEALEEISNERVLLHDLARFRERLSQLEESLQRKIQTYTQELNEFEQNLENVTTARSAQKLHEELLKKSSRYSNSEIEEQYEAISSNIKHLIELLQITESAKLNTVQACQAQLDRLTQWRDTIEDLTPQLGERVDSLCAELEQTKAQILQAQKAIAENWLKELGSQCSQLYRLIDDTQKLEAANQLLKQIQSQKPQYIELFSPIHQQSLEYIERQCIDERGKHKANQILVWFQELPRLQRRNLYEKLAEYLSDATEEFNG